MAMNAEELKSELENLKFSINKLQDLEDHLKEIANELAGIGSPVIKSKEEAKYKSGPKVYHCNIIELMSEEEELSTERDYYLFKVRSVAKFLQTLNDDQVYLLEQRYWDRFSIRSIAKMTYTSKSQVCRKLDEIFEKIN